MTQQKCKNVAIYTLQRFSSIAIIFFNSLTMDNNFRQQLFSYGCRLRGTVLSDMVHFAAVYHKRSSI